jgi:hypothetical protein
MVSLFFVKIGFKCEMTEDQIILYASTILSRYMAISQTPDETQWRKTAGSITKII